MKKYSAKLLTLIVIVIIVSIMILLIGYNKSICEILYELFLALFTGCVFAIPSYIVIFLESKRKTKRNIKSIIKTLKEILTTVNFDNNFNFGNSYNEEIEQLIQITNKLAIMETDYYVNDKYIDDINFYIIRITSNYKRIDKNFDSLTKQEKSNCLETIKQSKNKCLEIINKTSI